MKNLTIYLNLFFIILSSNILFNLSNAQIDCNDNKESENSHQQLRTDLTSDYYYDDNNGTDLEISQVNYRCSPQYPNCSFIVNLTNYQFSMINSKIYAPNVVIYSNKSISLDNQSSIVTDKQGSLYGPGFNEIVGASYAGQGGNCNGSNFDQTYGHYDMYFDNSEMFQYQFGSGGGIADSKGGGRIALISNNFTLQGNLSANGGPFVLTPDGEDINGGSGGYIYIEYTGNTSSAFQVSSSISAKGGDGYNNGNGGSGGRVVFNFTQATFQPSINQINVGGGISQKNINSCAYGAAGTIYFSNNKMLIIQGNGQQAQPDSTKKTPIERLLPTDESFNYLQSINIVNSGVATVKITEDTTQLKNIDIKLKDLTISKGIFTTPINPPEVLYSFTIESSSITINQDSIITTKNAQNTTFICDKFTMNDLSTLETGQVLFMYTNDTILKTKVVLNNLQHKTVYQEGLYKSKESTYSFIHCNNSFNLSQGTVFVSNYVSLISNDKISISGTFLNSDKNLSTCSDHQYGILSFVTDKNQLPLHKEQLISNVKQQFHDLKDQNLTIYDILEPMTLNFTHTLIALNELIISSNSQVISPRIGLYSAQISIYGTLKTNGLGCQADQGPGKGYQATATCGGSGGAYGGFGGMAGEITQIDEMRQLNIEQIKIRQGDSPCINKTAYPYGNYQSNQVAEGSGGGSSKPNSAGAGGGIIWLQCSSLHNDGMISSDGTNAEDGTASGGGSGGIIFISINQLSGSGQFTARGGRAYPFEAGGGGSGGRVLILFFEWFISSENYVNRTNRYTRIEAPDVFGGAGGKELSNGMNGTIWSTPCIAGYEGLFCRPCQKGYFKNDMSNVDCQPCATLPPGEGNAVYTKEGMNNPVCPYECAEDLTPVSDNPNCLGDFDLFLSNLGGIQIFIIIIIATAFGIGCVLVFLKCVKDPISEEEEEHLKLKRAFEQLDFLDNDLQQHAGRVYMLGENTFISKWNLSEEIPISLKIKFDSFIYTGFIDKINSSEKWTLQEKILYMAITFIYPAVVPFVRKYLRKRHYNNFKKIFIENVENNSYIKSVQDRVKNKIQIRFTGSDDYTLSYLDFIDLNRELESYVGPNLPMTLVLCGHGTFSSPYYLNLRDPLVKSVSYFCNDSRIWNKFVTNLNSKLALIQVNSFIFYQRIKILQVMKYLKTYTDGMFSLCGFKLSLWVLELKRDIKEDRIDFEEDYFPLNYEYLTRRPSVLTNFLEYQRRETQFQTKKQFKLAIMVMRSDSTQQADDTGNTKNQQPKKEQHFTKHTKITKQNQTTPILTPIGQKRGNSQENYHELGNDKYVQLLNSYLREDYVNYGRIKIFKDITKPCKHYLLDFLSFFVAIVSFFTLRHSAVWKRFAIFIVFFIIFVVLDIMITMQVVLHIFEDTINEEQIYSSYGWTFIYIYPFACFFSPILGILAFIMCKPFVYRGFAYINSLSIFTNVLIMFIAECIRGTDGFKFYLFNVLILLVIKIIQAQLISLQISYFKNPKYHSNQLKLDAQMKSTFAILENQIRKTDAPQFNFHDEDDDDD